MDSQLCLGYQVFAQPTDAGTFGPMLERIANWTGVKPKSVLVDATYVTACNLAICDQAGILLYGPWQENDFSHKKKKTPGAKPRPTVELGFADVKQHRSMRQFSGRGRCRAQRQVGLTMLVHNLLVVHRAKPPPENSLTAMLTTEEITT